MKIIFIDIDGVFNNPYFGKLPWPIEEIFRSLNAHRFLRWVFEKRWVDKDSDNREYIKFDTEAVAALNQIIEATGASLVVSSTWRIRGLDAMRSIFEREGVRGEIVGLTGQEQGIRGLEIGEWLGYCNFKGKFVIIDDDTDIHPFENEFVWTPVGLKLHHVNHAINILNNEY